MKLLYIYIFIILLCFFNCAENQVKFDFCKKKHKIEGSTCFYIKNSTDSKYAFFLPSFSDDNDWVYYPGARIIVKDNNDKDPPVSSIYKDKLMPNNSQLDSLYLSEKKDSLFWKNILKKGVVVDYYWVKKYKFLRKNMLILKRGEEKQFSKQIFLLEKQIKQSGGYYIFDPKKKYTIQIEVIFDSTIIKKQLLATEADSLKRNNIKIFHGKLLTSKIPISLD